MAPTRTPHGYPVTRLRAGDYTVATPAGEWTIRHEPDLRGWLVQDRHDGEVCATLAEALRYLDATLTR
jgi:hypothetical protein